MRASGSAIETNLDCLVYHRDTPAGGLIASASGPADPQTRLHLPLWGIIQSPTQPARVRAECNVTNAAVGGGPFVDVGFTATRVENLNFPL